VRVAPQLWYGLGPVGAWLGQETWRSIDGPIAGRTRIGRVGTRCLRTGRDTIDSEVELTAPDSTPVVLLYGQ